MTESDEQGEAIRLLLASTRAFARTQNELGRHFARSRGMHPTDAAAVVEILTAEEQGEPITPMRLAPRLGLTTGATSTMLNRLEEAGHVTRSRDQRDRRVVTLRSTPSIHEQANAFYGVLGQRLHDVLQIYDVQQLRLVTEVVDGLTAVAGDHLEDRGITGGARGVPDPRE